MQLSTWGKGIAIGVAALVIALFVNYLWGPDRDAEATQSPSSSASGSSSQTSGSPSASSTSSSQSSASPSQTTQQDLTVGPTALLPKQAQCTNDKFIPNSITGNGEKKWSDSVSTPFSSSTNSGKFSEVLSEDCGNPVFLDQNIQGLSRITINGWNVGGHNPWMAEFESQANKEGLNSFLTYELDSSGNFVTNDGTKEIFVTAKYQQYAAYTNTLLLQFHNLKITTEMSVSNWHLPGGGLVADKLARVEINKNGQENLPSLRMELTEKARGCEYVIGFNTTDKRLETFNCEHPAPPKAVTPSRSTPAKSTPVTSRPPSHSSQPKPKPTPTRSNSPKPTPKPTPTHKKPCPSPTPTKTHTTPPPKPSPSPTPTKTKTPKPTPTPTPTKTHTTPPPKPTPTPTPKPSCTAGQVGTYPHCLTPKDHSQDTTPVQGVTPAPVDTPEKTTPSPAPVQLDPTQTPGSDTGSDVPVQGATPMPTTQPSTGSSSGSSSEPVVQPTTDPSVAGTQPDPSTSHISDPG